MGQESETGVDLVQEMTAVEEEHRRAYLARDIAQLEALWADELIVNSPINRVLPKRRVLELLRAGTIAHVEFDADLETIERRGELAIVMGAERVVDSPGGPVIRRRFTDVWCRESGAWRLIARHANVIPAAG
jgi:ketosteroid isomerase-like protein